MTENSRDAILAAISDDLTRARRTADYRQAQADLGSALERIQRLPVSDRTSMELAIWMQSAVIAEHADDLQAAIEYCERLKIRSPENATTYLMLARLHRKVGNAEEEEASLRKCSELAERSGDKALLAILAAKGHLPEDADARARRLDDAVATYQQALKDRTLEASPNRYALTQSNLGNLYRLQAEYLVGAARTRRLEEAINAYHEALKGHTPDSFPDENRVLLEDLRQVEKQLNDKL